MKDPSRTNQELLEENSFLNQKIKKLEQSESDRKQTEETLCKNEDLFRRLAENAQDMIYRMTLPDGKYEYVNPASYDITGYTPEEHYNGTADIKNIIHPDFSEYLNQQWKNLLQGEMPPFYEYKIIHKNGGERWVYQRNVLIRDESGLPIAIEGIVRDITDRKKTEAAIKGSEERYRNLAEAMQDMIFVINQDDCVEYVNQIGLRQFRNLSEKEIIGKPRAQLFPSEIAERHRANLQSVFQTGKPLNFEGVTAFPDHEMWHNTWLVPLKDDTGIVKSVLGVARDITDRKLAEKALQKSERRYREFFATSQDCVFITSKDGKWIDFNDAALEMFGYDSRKELSQVPISTLYVNPDERIMLTTLIEKQGYVKEYPVQLRQQDGTVIDTLITTGFRRDADTSEIEYYGTIRDITRRKHAEESLSKSERKFFSTFHLNPNPMAISDIVTSKFIDVNQAFTRWTGYTRGEVIGTSAQDLHLWVNPEDRGKIIDVLMAAGEVNSEEVMARQKNGNIRIVLFSARFIEIGQERYFLTLAHDITARKQAEENLRQSEENYRSIFENAQEGIYRTTPEGRFVMANQAMARILGYDSPKELMDSVTNIAHQLYVNPEERTKVIELIERQGFAKDDELQFYRKDGRTIWVYRTMRLVRDEKKQLLFYEGIIQDITDRKEGVARLRKALGGTVRAIASMVETRDPYTAGHQSRVADLARAIAREIGLSDDTVDTIRMAGIIHDIGKISVPVEILSKPGKLSDMELKLIKVHSQTGYDILKDVGLPYPIAEIVLQHHERLDGSGYPQGLNGDRILIESKIIAVADVVEAIATHRPYRPARGIGTALEEIEKNKGILYDAGAVEVCLKLFREKGFSFGPTGS